MNQSDILFYVAKTTKALKCNTYFFLKKKEVDFREKICYSN